MGAKSKKKATRKKKGTSRSKKKDSKKKQKKEETLLEEFDDEEEEEEDDDSSMDGAIEWSFDDDEDEDEEEEEEEITYARKKPIPPGVKKKMQELVTLVTRLQKQLIQKERDIYDNKNTYNVLSADFAEMQEEFEWHKTENQKKDAIIDKYKSKINRLNDDFDKVKDRIRGDKDDLQKKASSKVMKKTVDMMDNFDKAIEVNEGKEELREFLEGFKLIHKQMEHILETEGVEAIDALNKAFNPKLHDAVDIVNDPSIPEDTVVEVSKKGYIQYEEVLRPAIVKVSKGGPPREDEPEEEEPEEEEKEEPIKKEKEIPKGEAVDDFDKELEDEGMWGLDEEDDEEEEEKPKKKSSKKKKPGKNIAPRSGKKGSSDKKKKKPPAKKKKPKDEDEFSELDDLWTEEDNKPKKGKRRKKSRK